MASQKPPAATKGTPKAARVPEAPPVDDTELERLRTELEQARLELLQVAGDADVKEAPTFTVPTAVADPDEMAGQRQNTNSELQPIRKDEQGRVWYQEEVRKPSFAKPRGRRVLQYQDTGAKSVNFVGADGTTETFEVAGDQARRPSEVKITLPSYQVGIYKDPRLPFKIHEYNDRRGFDLFEVAAYYGGPELVPSDIKRVYVENVLCYDIRTVVQSIQREYRQLQLAGRIK